MLLLTSFLLADASCQARQEIENYKMKNSLAHNETRSHFNSFEDIFKSFEDILIHFKISSNN